MISVKQSTNYPAVNPAWYNHRALQDWHHNPSDELQELRASSYTSYLNYSFVFCVLSESTTSVTTAVSGATISTESVTST